jgi:hypothetical protein
LFSSYFCLYNVVVKVSFYEKGTQQFKQEDKKDPIGFHKLKKQAHTRIAKSKQVVLEIVFFPCLQHGVSLALSILHLSKQVASKFYKAYQI